MADLSDVVSLHTVLVGVCRFDGELTMRYRQRPSQSRPSPVAPISTSAAGT
jgi:hypothetical protein